MARPSTLGERDVGALSRDQVIEFDRRMQAMIPRIREIVLEFLDNIHIDEVRASGLMGQPARIAVPIIWMALVIRVSEHPPSADVLEGFW